AAEDGSITQIAAHDLFNTGRRDRLGQMDQGAPARFDRIAANHAAGDAFVVLTEFLESTLPAVALVGNERLEDGQRDRLRAGTMIFDSAGGLRNSLEEMASSEESADLELRVDARLEPAKQFQQQAPPIEDE